MSAVLSAARKRNDVLELMMVTIYVVLTAYLFACNAPPRIVFALRDAVTPFQVIVRARHAGTARSIAAWRSSQFESRTRTLSRWTNLDRLYRSRSGLPNGFMRADCHPIAGTIDL